MSAFGKELAHLMTVRGISGGRLAIASDVSHTMISRLCNGYRHPSPETIERIAAALALTDGETMRLYVLAYCPERFHDALLHRDRVVPLDSLMTELHQIGDAA